MNKQIRDFAIEAGYEPYTLTEEAFNEFSIEKFANLIISEALRICDEVSEPVDEDDPMVKGAIVCAEMIRENFGI